ncbi:2TM domain-containing protein [Robiginitalea marina]|uniref:2TM domain-containing protein n=1 Tax=Robiginitalea marina TaxID=2954105 RepID=A0ABT1AZ88_9FLAO|nr:2TM domain-containing protein [Robiginitalea marina]MCO5725359.1 2TM domain-containing protein [Robiginitalea marina]
MKKLLKHFGNATLVGLALYVVFWVIHLLRGGSLRWDADSGQELLEHMIFSWILYLANALLISYAIGWLRNHNFHWKVLLVTVMGNIAVSLLGIFLARSIILTGFNGVGFLEFIKGESAAYYVNSLVIALCVSAIFFGLYYYKYRQETRVKQEKIIAGAASAQFDALKNQLDPHFLFNSLNVLTSLIEEDPQQAQRFTTGLSKVYRYVLEQKNKEVVPVDEEFAFARTYVRLLKMRFEDSIVFDIPEQSTNPEGKIVPLSLQLLLENAVKHNVVTQESPLHIRVEERGGFIVVANTLQPKQVVKKSSGVGLQNIRNRYSLLTRRQVAIKMEDGTFEVAIPILTRQVTQPVTQEAFVEDKRYQKAKEKVEAIKGFYGNLGAYLLVIPFLAWLNWKSTSFPWALFPAVGWGFGLVMHGLEAYGYNPLWGKRWEARKIRELMERDDW